MLPLVDEDASGLLAGVPEDSRDDCWWLVRRDGTPVPGDGGGAVALFYEVTLTRPLARVARALHVSGLLDALDKLVAQHRGRLGRLVADGPAPRSYP